MQSQTQTHTQAGGLPPTVDQVRVDRYAKALRRAVQEAARGIVAALETQELEGWTEAGARRVAGHRAVIRISCNRLARRQAAGFGGASVRRLSRFWRVQAGRHVESLLEARNAAS